MKRVVVAIAASAFAVVVTPTLASADTVPFSDPAQHGLITLCDGHGHQLTSGDIRTIPFVVKAISSSAAPKGYESGLDTLYAYQPLQYVDPGNWTGYQLSGSTYFSNPAHPGAQMTPGDGPLISFTSGYPLHWDGLMQLRMIYTARYTPAYSGGYPTAILRVKGMRWTAVQVGHTPCNATRTKSFEELALRKNQYAPTNVPATAETGVGSSSHAGQPGAPGTSGAAGAAPDAVAQQGAGGGSTGGSAVPWIVAAMLAVLAVSAGGMWWRRRRLPVDEGTVNGS